MRMSCIAGCKAVTVQVSNRNCSAPAAVVCLLSEEKWCDNQCTRNLTFENTKSLSQEHFYFCCNLPTSTVCSRPHCDKSAFTIHITFRTFAVTAIFVAGFSRWAMLQLSSLSWCQLCICLRFLICFWQFIYSHSLPSTLSLNAMHQSQEIFTTLRHERNGTVSPCHIKKNVVVLNKNSLNWCCSSWCFRLMHYQKVKFYEESNSSQELMMCLPYHNVRKANGKLPKTVRESNWLKQSWDSSASKMKQKQLQLYQWVGSGCSSHWNLGSVNQRN